MNLIKNRFTYPIRLRLAFIVITVIYLFFIFGALIAGIFAPKWAITGMKSLLRDACDLYEMFELNPYKE